MSKPGELKPATKAFIDWYDNAMTKELIIGFNEEREARNWQNSITKYMMHHNYVWVNACLVDPWTVSVLRMDDDEIKYEGFVRLNCIKGGDISHMAWVKLRAEQMALAKRQKEAGMKSKKEKAQKNG